MAGKILVKRRLLVLSASILLHMNGFCQSDISLDSNFKSVSESWHIKVRQNGLFGKKPALIGFGPLKTMNTDIGKRTEATKDVDRYLSSKNIHDKKSYESSMDLLIDPSDSVQIRMIFVKEDIRSRQSVFGIATNSGTDNNNIDQMTSYVGAMTLRFSIDSSVWYFARSDSARDTVYASLMNIRDSANKILIYRSFSLLGKQLLLKPPALGYVFVYRGEQVAAFQTIFKETAWISKSVDTTWKDAILSTIAAMMATIKAGNSDGY